MEPRQAEIEQDPVNKRMPEFGEDLGQVTVIRLPDDNAIAVRREAFAAPLHRIRIMVQADQHAVGRRTFQNLRCMTSGPKRPVNIQPACFWSEQVNGFAEKNGNVFQLWIADFGFRIGIHTSILNK
jgi:hypothetical protein